MPVPAALKGGRHPFEGAAPDLGVPHHPLAPGHDGPARLELGLDQEDQIGLGAAERPAEHGHHRDQGDEGQVGRDQRAGLERRVALAQHLGRQGAHVDPFEHRDPAVAAQALVELAVADVDGVDVGRPPLEEAVGEATGGGPGIEGAPARRRRRRTA